jgi:ubiquinone/menaquinone biosynthesis C-methylase UbiE
MRHAGLGATWDDRYISLYGRIFAAGYDRAMRGSEHAGLAQMRARLLLSARGRTLELGAGTGLNLRHYPRDEIVLTLTEPEASMTERLERRVAASRPDANVVQAPADRLPFEDASFDSVVSTLVLCTVRDQAQALAEVRRVLSPDGALLFLEHVRSDDPHVARWQDRIHPLWSRLGHGCHCNRDTLASLQAAGFRVNDVQHTRMPKAPAIVRPLIVGHAQPG